MTGAYKLVVLCVTFLSVLEAYESARWVDAKSRVRDSYMKRGHGKIQEIQEKNVLGDQMLSERNIELSKRRKLKKGGAWVERLKQAMHGKNPSQSRSAVTNRGFLSCSSASGSTECGESTLNEPDMQHYIVGGQEAKAGMFPWQVALSESPDLSGTYGVFCGGSYVVGNDGSAKVVTAAHCVEGIELEYYVLYVTFGLLDRTQPEGSVTLKVTNIIRHPEYDSESMWSDIAVLETDTPASDLPSSATPVCLAKVAHEGGELAYVSGWGNTAYGGETAEVLRYVEKKLLTLEQCKATGYEEEEITEAMVCAGEEGKDSCQGDSGGPLVTKNSTTGKWELIGVVSWGHGCGWYGYPGVYANVPYLYPWLETNL